MERIYSKFSITNDKSYSIHITTSDPYENRRVKKEDHMLHQALTEIFHEHCHTSDQVKELLGSKQSLVKLILDREPALSEILLKGKKYSLLWIAVLSSYQNSAELLVRSGADVNERYERASSILYLLLKMYPSSWNDRFFALLLEHGANFRVQCCTGQTFLYYAVVKNRVQAVKLLLEKGADVNVVGYQGRTALLEAACSSKADELVPLLLKHGADVSARDKKGMNALHHLAGQKLEEHVEVARALIEKGVLLDDREHFSQYQPIHRAVLGENNKLVKLFLDHGADVNARSIENESPLHLAATISNPAVLKTLLERGADIDIKTNDGQTALHYACSSVDSQEHIKILLSVGADMYATKLGGQRPAILIRDRHIKNPMIKLMIRMHALKKSFQPPSAPRPCKLLNSDGNSESIGQQYWTFYHDCYQQIGEMKLTRFVKSCTFYELLTKCQCQIAPLMRNPEFETKFRLYNLDALFSVFAGEILEAFERTRSYYNSVLEQEAVIDEALYNILPHLIVRKMASYVTNCEACELRKIAHASRDNNKQQ